MSSNGVPADGFLSPKCLQDPVKQILPDEDEEEPLVVLFTLRLWHLFSRSRTSFSVNVCLYLFPSALPLAPAGVGGFASS